MFGEDSDDGFDWSPIAFYLIGVAMGIAIGWSVWG